MKGTYSFTAIIERDPETGPFVGYIPELPGAHTQAETLDELNSNLKEVIGLVLEELTDEEFLSIKTEYIGSHKVSVTI
jgi:predicted RNase H-like HicB family nuclease